MTTRESKNIQVLRAIYDLQTEKGYPPTVREIGERVGLSSSSTIHGHISRLIQKGYLTRDADDTGHAKARATEITESGRDILGVSQTPGQIPVLGVVTAGEPIFAYEQEVTEYFPLPEDLEHYDGDLFMLLVKGDSMINMGILDGDKVIVRKQQFADNGDVVVAMNDDGEATVKRFFRRSDHFELMPENDDMAPIILTSVEILGKVVALYRDAIY